MTTEPATPQHDKYRPHQDEGQIIGEFLEWLQSKAGGDFVLCKYGQPEGWSSEWPMPVRADIQELLAGFFDIDFKAYCAEKEAVYQYVSERANAPTT